MIKNKIDFSCTSFDVINDENQILRSRKVSKQIKYKELIKSNFIGLSTVVFNKKIHSKIKFPNLNTQEDFAYG